MSHISRLLLTGFLFQNLLIFESKIGLFPDILNYKEIKVIIASIKDLSPSEVTSHYVAIDFTDFYQFLQKCSNHWMAAKRSCSSSLGKAMTGNLRNSETKSLK